ncbi:hypothetical protein [Sporomusa sp. GT1]|uniref:hypothetical protein n=1 Tax=Sporomusa sp. GT1 TaxID=1534747 RepID=UPI00166B3531|nr:hypothetical protein [Sporomusa sp. GT1]
MQFKIWPFETNEIPTLYWLTSPRKNASGWVMDAVFKRQPGHFPRILRVEVPWGTLPYLRIGRKYRYKGQLDETSKSGVDGNLSLSQKHRGQVIPAFSMPRELRSFYGDEELSQEMVWVMDDGNKTYYIPCLELIRAFLASSVYMTNHLLFPTAIEDMVLEEDIRGNVLDMVLNPRIPPAIANNSTAFHIAWLRHNQAARQMWTSVLATQRQRSVDGHLPTIETVLQSGIPLECEPPSDIKYNIGYQGFYSGSNWLIQEITSIKGFDIPFDEVYFSHPLLPTTRFEDGENNKPRSKTKVADSGQEFELDNQGGAAKPTSYQPKIIVSTVEFSAKRKLKIKRISNKKSTIERDKVDGEKNIWRLSHEVTTQENRHAGYLRPIEVGTISYVEFNNLSLENRQGLKEFMHTLNLIQDYRPNWVIQIEFMPVPKGTRISKVPSGEPRMCAVVRIDKNLNTHPVWIVEVSRPDCWPISTSLFSIKKKTGENQCAEKIDKCDFISSINNEGHWHYEMLKMYEQLLIRRVVHTGSGFKKWMKRIIEKIELF